MTVVRRVIKSCCGRKNFFFDLDKPIRKFQLSVLESAGYISPKNFVLANIFYVRGHDIVATSSYGTTRINVHCYGKNCEEKLNDFEKAIEQAVNTIRLTEP